MKILNSFWQRFRSLWQRREVKLEIDEELRFHIEQRTAENIATGMSPEEAGREARKRFGNVQSVREECRETRGASFGETTLQDIRFGLRMLRKNPGFTTVAVLTLALGIGANTAVFSVLHTVLLRPLPYSEPGRLVALWERHPETSDRNVVSAGNYLDWQEQNFAFEALGAYGSFGGDMRGDGPPQPSAGARLTPGLFRLLGVQPMLGRSFIDGENAEAGGREILISHACWQTRFGGRLDILGKTVHLEDTPMTVVGVMPPTFEFPSRNLDFWLALRFDAADRESRKTREWRVLGRLKPGTSVATAQVAMDGVAARIALAHPQFMAGWGVHVVPYHTDLVRNVRPTILILVGVVAAVLLVACANVANLMLARAAGRQRELAIRGALGAGRVRIVRQLLTESALLAGLGTIAGLLLAGWAVDFLAALTPGGLPGIAQPTINGTAFGFAAATLVVATGIVGFAPASWLSRLDLRSFLQGSRTESSGVLLHRTRNVLLVTQLALATVLLVGAGLLLRSMFNLHRVDFGFDPQNLLTATVNLPNTRYKTIADQAAFCERLREQLTAIPGVVAVSGISDPPLSSSSTFSFVLADRPRSGPNPRENPVEVRSVTPNHFQTIRLPLISGRAFADSDQADSPGVAIVNQAFVKLHFPDGKAVGQRLSFVGQGGPWVEIVGVAGDIKDAGHDQPSAPAIYTPYVQKRVLWLSALTVMIRTSGDPVLIQEQVRRAFLSVDGELPIRRISPMPVLYANRLTQRDFMARLIGGFAALTLSLGVIGVYGVISYSVTQRRREFGICLALGAGRWDIIRRVMGDGVRLVVIGALLGAAGAMGLARFLGNLLFEIQPMDPLTFVSVLGLLGIVSLIALWFPARQAARVDPMEALRCE